MRRIFKIDISQNRIFGLDLLRALAILFVVIGHGNYLLPEAWAYYLEYLVFDGVAIFFVLSGFLIGGILIRKIQQPFTGHSLLLFWIRRWCRTLPSYFLVLTVLCIANYFLSRQLLATVYVFPYYTFSQNLLWAHPDFFGEGWSISVEEWFYLLMPLLVFSQLYFFKQKPQVALLSTAVLILVGVTCFRWYRYEHIQMHGIVDWDLQFRKQVFTRLDSLMYGVIGAFLNFYYPGFWKKYKNSWLLAGVLLFLFIHLVHTETVRPFGFYHSVFSFSTVSLATLLLLPALSAYRSEKGWFFKVVTYISLISYSLYLLHLGLVQLVLIKGFNKLYDLPPGINYIIYWTLSLALSTLLYKYYERPTTALRDHPVIKALVLRRPSKQEGILPVAKEKNEV